MKILIAVPSRDQVQARFAHDLAYMVGSTVASRPDLDLDLCVEVGTVIPRLRENLAMEAVKRGVDGILWLDTDMWFPNDTLLRLVMSGEKIIGANCPSRRPPIMPTAWDEGGPVYTDEYSPDRQAVERMSLAVAYTSTEVFTAIPQPWFPLEWDDEAKDYVGEDRTFSRKARLAGFDLTVDHVLSRQIRHEGVTPYTHGHALMYRARSEVRA